MFQARPAFPTGPTLGGGGGGGGGQAFNLISRNTSCGISIGTG